MGSIADVSNWRFVATILGVVLTVFGCVKAYGKHAVWKESVLTKSEHEDLYKDHQQQHVEITREFKDFRGDFQTLSDSFIALDNYLRGKENGAKG